MSKDVERVDDWRVLAEDRERLHMYVSLVSKAVNYDEEDYIHIIMVYDRGR